MLKIYTEKMKYGNRMLFKLIILSLSTFVLLACHSVQPQKLDVRETKECMAYRAMMTAPMDPLAMQSLKEKCIKSKNK